MSVHLVNRGTLSCDIMNIHHDVYLYTSTEKSEKVTLHEYCWLGTYKQICFVVSCVHNSPTTGQQQRKHQCPALPSISDGNQPITCHFFPHQGLFIRKVSTPWRHHLFLDILYYSHVITAGSLSWIILYKDFILLLVWLCNYFKTIVRDSFVLTVMYSIYTDITWVG